MAIDPLDKDVWEGWTPRNFIDEIEWFVENDIEYEAKPITRATISRITSYHQPYYKKPIKEVVDYFCKKHNIR